MISSEYLEIFKFINPTLVNFNALLNKLSRTYFILLSSDSIKSSLASNLFKQDIAILLN